MGDVAVQLDEASLIKQKVEPFARGKLALLVLLGHTRGAPALLGEGLTAVEVVQELARVGHGGGR